WGPLPPTAEHSSTVSPTTCATASFVTVTAPPTAVAPRACACPIPGSDAPPRAEVADVVGEPHGAWPRRGPGPGCSHVGGHREPWVPPRSLYSAAVSRVCVICSKHPGSGNNRS